MEYEVRNVNSHGSVVTIPRQTAAEVYEIMSFLLEEWQDFCLTSNYILLNINHPFYAGLSRVYISLIYGVLVTNDKVFILCLNGTLYTYFRERKAVEILLPISISWAYGRYGLRFAIFRVGILCKCDYMADKILSRFRMEKDFWLECVFKDRICRFLFLVLFISSLGVLVLLCFRRY